MEQTFETKRQIWIDIYKGIAIMLVVFGHLEIPQNVYNFIFIFHMYAFFFVSGITFKVDRKTSFKVYLKDNIKRLYIPYLFFAFAWDVTNVVVQFYINKSIDISVWGAIKNIAGVLIGGGVFKSSASIGPAWFLLALLVIRVVCWLIIRISNDKMAIFGIFSVLCFVLGFLSNGFSFFPFKIFSTLTAFLFVFFGYCTQKYVKKIKCLKTWILSLISVVCFGCVWGASWLADEALILVSNTLPSNPILVLIGGSAGCFGLLLLSFLLEKMTIISKFFAYYGINSLIIMGIHSEINFASRFCLEVLLKVPQIYRAGIIFTITLVLVVPICAILNNHFPILIGKRKG